MLQSFNVATSPETGPVRLKALRNAISDAGLDGFLVPRADRYQGENVAPCDERLAWLTGFTGSAGFACVLPDLAGVFIDGRYRVQVRAEVADVFTPVHWPEVQLAAWLKEQLPDGGRIGIDPWLHTVGQLRDLRAALNDSGITIDPVGNLVDQVWTDRPPPPRNPMTVQPDDLAGESHADKRARLAAELSGDMAYIAAPESICWLLNIRGSDIARTPVVHGSALLSADGTVQLFTDATVDTPLLDHLGDSVTVIGLDQMCDTLSGLSQKVQIDPSNCPQAVMDLLTQTVEAPDPCTLPKACKNPVEIAGARAAHLRDGAAMVNFLAWLDQTAPSGTLTEIDVVTALEEFRRETGALKDISFDTISGAGPNGAIVHYRVDENTNRTVQPGELLLVDSGGQYVDGTTDITRTMAIGTVGSEERDTYTRVLQGMVAISRLRFPKGISGAHIDAIARAPLWSAGRDYDHGTGHGVGAFLGVHEGPQSLSGRSHVPLEPGMILSNEPGYYREGSYGIRIENLIVVQPATEIPDADTRDMLEFETLTFVPLDRRLINVTLLSQNDRAWIDSYHMQVLEKIGPMVTGAARNWLEAACAPL